MVAETNTVASGKTSMDKINESMAKIGSMLGVEKSPSSNSDDSKAESLIKHEEHILEATQAKKATTDTAAPLLNVNSAEGQVISAPHEQEREMAADGSIQSGATGVATRPTMPGKTKTAVGAALASFAATLDNAVNGVNKSCRKISETTKKAAAESADAACGSGDAEEALLRGNVTADGTTITQYVPLDKHARKPIAKWVYLVVGAVLAIVLSLTIASVVPGTRLNIMFTNLNDDMLAQNDPNVSIAFIGNSYLYVNDVPRVMECVSKSKITQDSVLNTGAGLGSLLKQGSGMYPLWQTQSALDFWGTWDFRSMMSEYNIEVDEDYSLYDYGMCTVPQLLEGYDNYLSYRNQNGIYFDVGTNPCFQDQYYMTIISHKYDKEAVYHDYIVLNDQTRRMASEDGRQDSIDALTQAYVSLIRVSRAVPIIIDTHAFLFDASAEVSQEYYQQLYGGSYQADEAAADDGLNEEEWDEVDEDMTLEEASAIVDISTDIPLFQAAIYEGLYEYVDALKYFLTEKQHPKIAPIGLTYLAIYDDNKNMYAKLFAQDGIHASQHGTYLFACVLYCTIYGHLPMQPHDDFDIRSAFFKSRAMFGDGATPSMSDVKYLRYWARRVAVSGFIPNSMVMPSVQTAQEQAVERGYNQTVNCDEAEEGVECTNGEEEGGRE
jgi:hypothetical protein